MSDDWSGPGAELSSTGSVLPKKEGGKGKYSLGEIMRAMSLFFSSPYLNLISEIFFNKKMR